MSQVPSRNVGQFWEGIYADIAEFLKETAPEVAEVGAMSLGSTRVTRRGESYDATAELLPTLSLYPPTAGKPVLILKSADGAEFVLGAIAEAAEPAPISQAQADGLYIPFGSGYLATADANFATGASAASNNSTATWATALSCSIPSLQPGTYRVVAWGGFIATHTVASGNADLRLSAVGDGSTVNGTIKSPTVHGTALAPMALHAADTMGGVVRSATGAITVTLEYRCNTAGTTTARNAWIAALAYRTA